MANSATAAQSESWFRAVYAEDVGAVERMGAPHVNERDPQGRTALSIAAWLGNEPLARVLVGMGADPNLPEAPSGFIKVPTPQGPKDYSLFGRSPLAIALSFRHNDLARWLIQVGADLKAEDARGYNLLWNVCDGQIAERLITAGLDPKKGPSKPRPYDFIAVPRPLWNAVTCPDPDVTRVFLKAGADPNHARGGKDSPLHIATQAHAAPETIRLLIDAGANVNARNNDGETPLMYAAQFHESPEVLRVLLRMGADLSATDRLGKTALQRVREPNAEEKRSVLESAAARR